MISYKRSCLAGLVPCKQSVVSILSHILKYNQKKQEMCASQNTPVYINYQTVKNYIYSNGDLDL